MQGLADNIRGALLFFSKISLQICKIRSAHPYGTLADDAGGF